MCSGIQFRCAMIHTDAPQARGSDASDWRARDWAGEIRERKPLSQRLRRLAAVKKSRFALFRFALSAPAADRRRGAGPHPMRFDAMQHRGACGPGIFNPLHIAALIQGATVDKRCSIETSADLD